MVAIDNTRALSPRIAYRIVASVYEIATTVAEWRRAAATQRKLEALTDAELDDIGLTRGEILAVTRGLVR